MHRMVLRVPTGKKIKIKSGNFINNTFKYQKIDTVSLSSTLSE